MKILKYIIPLLLIVFISSCEQNVVEYQSTPVGDNVAEFQLHYFVPVTAVAANNITKVELNGKILSNSTAPITTYNGIPSGSVGRFYTTNTGANTIKMYQGTNADKLVYESQVSLTNGKQNVFVHDFNKPPVVFTNGFPYTVNTTEDTDSTCWVKFYNLLYETTGTPTTLKIQYQYVDTRTKELINIGSPIAFAETTGWQPVKIVKTINNSSGYSRIDYKIKVIDAGGNVVGDLEIINNKNVYTAYSGFFTEYIGRRYHHILSGLRSAVPYALVREFTAL